MRVKIDGSEVTFNGDKTLSLVKDDILIQKTKVPSNVQLVVKFCTFVKPKGGSTLSRFISVIPVVWKFCKE